MHTASAWLSAPQTSSRCDIAHRPACRAQGHRARHAPSNQQQGVWQAAYAPPATSAAAAAAASIQELLELQHIQLDVQDVLTDRRSSHAAVDTNKRQHSRLHCTSNGCSRSAADDTPLHRGIRQLSGATTATEDALTNADSPQQLEQQHQELHYLQEQQFDHQQQQQHLQHLDGVVSSLVQDAFLQDSCSSRSGSSIAQTGSTVHPAVDGWRIGSKSKSQHHPQPQMQQVHASAVAQQQQVMQQQLYDHIQQPDAAAAAAPKTVAVQQQQQQQSAGASNAQHNVHHRQLQQSHHSRLEQLLVPQQDANTLQQQQQRHPHVVQQQQLHWQHQVQLQQQHASTLLSRQVAAASSWQQVGRLLDTLESNPAFGPKHVVRLLLQLERLVLLQQRQQQEGVTSGAAFAYPVARHEQPEYVDLVYALLRMATAALPTLQHSDIACLAASAARLPAFVTIPKPWCVRLMTRAHHIMSDFSPTSLAVLTWALGKLNMGLRSDFSDKLIRRCRECIGSTSPRALSLLLHGLVGVKAQPDGVSLGVIVARVHKLMRQFDGWELSMCLWGLVRLRCPVPRSFLTSALSQLITRLPDSTNHEIALTVWAIGRLGYTFSSSSNSSSDGTLNNSSGTPAVSSEQQQRRPRMKQIHTQQEQLLRLLQQRIDRGSVPAHDLTTLLYGLALMHSVPDNKWRTTALAAVERGLGQLDGQGLSNLLYAVGLLRWQPDSQWQISSWKALVAQVQKVQPIRRHQQQRQRQHKQQRGRGGSGSLRGVRLQLAGQQQQLPGLSCKSWEQLHEAQRLLGWRLPLNQLQQLQEQQRLHRISRSQIGTWALQVQQHLQQQQQQQYLQESGQSQHNTLNLDHQQQQQPWVAAHCNGHGGLISVQQLTVLPCTTVPQGLQ